MKGYLIGLGLSGLLGVSLAMGVGCSSSSSGGGSGTPSGTYCDITTGAAEECTGYSGGDSSGQQQFTSACTMGGGKIVSSCPTANALGCCTITSDNVSASSCTYCPSPETQMGAQMACTSGMGTWTAGSETACSTGDSGTSSGGGDSGTSSGGGDSGTAGD